MKIIRLAIMGLLSVLSFASGLAHAAESPSSVENTLPRAQLLQLIQKGPQALIASVEVVPHSVKGQFVGFKITAAQATSPMANSQTIQVGDVLLSVKGHSLERPDQFMRAWGSLAKRKIISVKILRGTQRMQYRWVVTP